MSPTSGIHRPHTPLRRFLDRELSAGATRLRNHYRARHHGNQLLLPGPGSAPRVGTEGGTVGTAIDYWLRLSFTAAKPVDPVAVLGMLHLGTDDVGVEMRIVGQELAVRLSEVGGQPKTHRPDGAASPALCGRRTRALSHLKCHLTDRERPGRRWGAISRYDLPAEP
ncbi:hypothetical protein ACFWOB_14615 [Streptomyces sp. NPDC058420]|uniref:hypothetical protein n=1 Tax=Streptomyces sp. NPDC058420 TaxID=3346489 RepID=UPI00364A886A